MSPLAVCVGTDVLFLFFFCGLPCSRFVSTVRLALTLLRAFLRAYVPNQSAARRAAPFLGCLGCIFIFVLLLDPSTAQSFLLTLFSSSPLVARPLSLALTEYLLSIPCQTPKYLDVPPSSGTTSKEDRQALRLRAPLQLSACLPALTPLSAQLKRLRAQAAGVTFEWCGSFYTPDA
jgi:hypothetical protein